MTVQYQDIADAVEAAIQDHVEECHRDAPVPQPIVPIPPFPATVESHAGSDSGGPVRVIGIRQREEDGMIELIALVTGDDGSVWPEAFDSVQSELPY